MHSWYCTQKYRTPTHYVGGYICIEHENYGFGLHGTLTLGALIRMTAVHLTDDMMNEHI